MGFLDYIKSAWEWVKGAIQKVWARFKVFLVKVANFGRTVIGAVRNLVQKAMQGIQNLREKFKSGLKKLFLIFTKKTSNSDGFKGTITTAIGEGKIGTAGIDANDIFGDSSCSTSDYDAHIVQTDNLFNTENVYSVSADKLTDDMVRRATSTPVSEININGL